jgi:trk system potassium uptake protein TrkH
MQKTQKSAAQLLVLGFAAMILAGALLLMLPFASRDGRSIPFINALFTATSASCVTGLVMYDTWTQFTLFGQAVIISLIQVGGLGFMIIAIEFSLAAGKRIGLRSRAMLSESVGASQIGGVVRLVRRVLIGTAMFEGAGAVIMSTRFIPLFGVARGIWYSVFHSISAFCNAGFDLMGIRKPSSSLTYFAGDPVISLTICSLIMIGGIGFIVWNDIAENKGRWKKLSYQSKSALFMTFAITVASTLLFLLFEKDYTLKGTPVGKSVLEAIFMSVTPRTAGFNTVDIASMSDASNFLTMLLMFIGASPGGTGGGLKTTTFMIVVAAMVASVEGRDEPVAGHHRISKDTLVKALSALSMYMIPTIFGTLILCAQSEPFMNSAYECLSAIGTVGLTTGITSTLRPLSKVVIILLMYVGRVGSMSVFTAFSFSHKSSGLRRPVGDLVV